MRLRVNVYAQVSWVAHTPMRRAQGRRVQCTLPSQLGGVMRLQTYALPVSWVARRLCVERKVVVSNNTLQVS
jgi:hypothetical protein